MQEERKVKSIKGFTLVELVTSLALCTVLIALIATISQNMSIIYHKIKEDEIVKKEVDTMKQTFDELILNAELQNEKILKGETLEDYCQVIKLYIGTSFYMKITQGEDITIERGDIKLSFKKLTSLSLDKTTERIVLTFEDVHQKKYTKVYYFYEE